MRNLAIVLWLKIVCTAVLWFIPLMFFPMSWLEHMGFKNLGEPLFLSLLGMAFGSLMVGYVFGVVDAHRNIYPHSTVWVGLVSNGGSFLLLCVAASRHTWSEWGTCARLFMWTSLAATGLVTTGLLLCGLFRRPGRGLKGGS